MIWNLWHFSRALVYDLEFLLEIVILLCQYNIQSKIKFQNKFLYFKMKIILFSYTIHTSLI